MHFVNTAQYQAVGKDVNLVVNKAAATVVLGATYQPYNGAPRPVTVTTYPAGLTTTVVYAVTGTAPVNAGSYAVTATIVEANFKGTAVGTLTVAKGTQTITFPTPTTRYVGDPDFSPGATASSGLGVTYTSSNPAVATVFSGTLIHCVAPGVTYLYAYQTGNANWNVAPVGLKLLTVGRR